MSFQEDKQGKIRRQTSKQAIMLAMESRWQESIEVNKSIIQSFPNDVDAYNRLGKAYMELGEYANAKEAYGKAAKLDQYNTIAKKNLVRLEHMGDQAPVSKEAGVEKVSPNLFIEEIGKAGVLNLYQIASSDKLVKMMAGDKVKLISHGTSLSVENNKGEYLGLVPAKQGQRLIKLMDGGNKYTAAVVASHENSISVIIRETYQDPSQTDQVSFPARKLEEIQPYFTDRVFQSEFEGEEEMGEAIAPIEEEAEISGEPEEVEEEKEWEQEA
jgi:tetratricopeptide (TPR) repeat protein